MLHIFKTYPELISILKETPKNERILFAARTLATWASRDHLSFLDSSREDKVIRIERFYKKSGSITSYHESFPIEITSDQFFEIFDYGKSGANKKLISNLIRLGEELGIWTYHPASNPGGRYYNAKVHQFAIIVLKGGWWRANLVYYDSKLREIIPNVSNGHEFELIRKVKSAINILEEAHCDFETKIQLPSKEECWHAWQNRVNSYEDTPDVVALSAIDILCDSDWSEHVQGGETIDLNGQASFSRIYSGFNLTWKIFRRLIRINGQFICGFDFTALHPNLIGKIIFEMGIPIPDFLTGDSHSKIGRLLKINPNNLKKEREAAKPVSLKYFNMNKTHAANHPESVIRKFHEFMTKNYPEILGTLDRLNKSLSFIDKKSGKRADDHAQLSRILSIHETHLIGTAVSKLRAKGISCDTCHDAIYGAVIDADAIKTAMTEAMNELGLQTKVTPV